MKTLLITGGAGFIGSNLIRYMLDKYQSYRIINLDSLTYAGRISNLLDIEGNNRYCFEKGDIADVDFVNDVFRRYDIDYVINLAAESHVDNSIKNPGIFIRTNVLGTQVLLDACKKAWTIEVDNLGYPVYKDGVKYLQISTDEVYGSILGQGKFLETTPLAPNSPYSASKASADLLVRAYNVTFKFPMNITRCSNNYGPYQFEEKLIPLMIKRAFHEKALPVYGDGRQIRDWLHVSDHCKAIDLVLHQGRIGEVYNVGGNNEMANIDIVKLILKFLDRSDTLIEFVQDRLGHDRRYAIDSSKLSEDLGWKPEFSFTQGMQETIMWYVDTISTSSNQAQHIRNRQ